MADAQLSHLYDGRIRLWQPRQGYRAAIDPAFLAAATAPPPAAQVLEIGCGVGAAALPLLRRRGDISLVGLELQPKLAALARRNLRENALSTRALVLHGDASKPPTCLTNRLFDWALANPPYFAAGRGGESPLGSKALAHREGTLDLAAWIDLLLRRLRPGGGLTVIQRADRLPDLLAALGERAGAIAILPLWPRAGQPAARVLVQAIKGRRSPAHLLPGLVLHRADGGYSDGAEAVLRAGQALSFT